jgi:hypothetical protein
MKNTPIHICAKSDFVGRPSTRSRQVISFHKFVSLNQYFKKCFKLVKTCGYGNFDHRSNVPLIHLHALFGVRKSTKMFRVCADRLCSGPRLLKV